MRKPQIIFQSKLLCNRAIDGIVAAKECNLNCGTERAIYSASDMFSSMYTLRQTRRTGRLEWRELADPSKVANLQQSGRFVQFHIRLRIWEIH